MTGRVHTEPMISIFFHDLERKKRAKTIADPMIAVSFESNARDSKIAIRNSERI